MIKAVQTGKFNQLLDELCFEDLELRLKISQKIERFQNNPLDTRLENHPLTKRMEGKWAFSITDDIRVVYEWIGKTTVRFLAIGGHEKVYSKTDP